jgi:hypothetical protein
VADDCSHPASQRSTSITETIFSVITTVTCTCGATVSENRAPKLKPSQPGTNNERKR